MTRSLVTGASGHLGANLVRTLLAAGDEVVALVREEADLRGLAGLEVSLARGDLLDAASIERAARGCDRIFHAGAVNRNWAADPETIIQPSVAGTRHVIAAAKAAGIRRVIHTSSNATMGYGKQPGVPLDETSHMQNAQSPYIRAKCQAEEAALSLGATSGVEVVVVNPVGIMGPFDFRLTPTSRAVRDIINGGPVVLAMCATHVRDVADAHLAAALRGTAGERYLVGGENAEAKTIAAAFSTLLGFKVRALKPPGFVLAIIARLEERKARRTGRDAEITRAVLADVAGGHLLYDSSKARRALAITPRGLTETLRDTIAWLVHIGVVSAKRQRVLGTRFTPDPSWPRVDERQS